VDVAGPSPVLVLLKEPCGSLLDNLKITPNSKSWTATEKAKVDAKVELLRVLLNMSKVTH